MNISSCGKAKAPCSDVEGSEDRLPRLERLPMLRKAAYKQSYSYDFSQPPLQKEHQMNHPVRCQPINPSGYVSICCVCIRSALDATMEYLNPPGFTMLQRGGAIGRIDPGPRVLPRCNTSVARYTLCG